MNQDVDKSMPEAVWRRLTERATTQDWPASALYVVATPIGNLIDMGLRAWQALVRCDVIAAEDTRASRTLLDAWGIATPLMAAHRHNEEQAAQAIIRRLASGERVGLISDAGAPAVSDPGARIVRRVQQAGYRVVPVPGPSAVITALMASGATSDENPAFVFAGFIPAKSAARKKWLQEWCFLPAPAVMFETPHRLRAAVEDLQHVCGLARRITFARELTKRFEQVETMELGQALDWLDQDAHRMQGEFVLIVHQEDEAQQDMAVSQDDRALIKALLEVLSVRDTARVVAKTRGLPRDVVYKAVLACSGESAS